jgi:SNF2 family DNA or RNA helicase
VLIARVQTRLSEIVCSHGGGAVQLLDYQIDTVKWMIGRERSQLPQPLGGFLCHDMGLGKTLQAMSLIFAHTPSKKRTLYVLPKSISDTLKAELLKFRLLNEFQFVTSRRGSSRDLGCPLVVTTYSVVQRGVPQWMQQVPWYRVMLDEAHAIKNCRSLTHRQLTTLCGNISDCRRWAMSATPMANRMEELLSIGKWVGLHDVSADIIIRQYMDRRTKAKFMPSLPALVFEDMVVDLDKEERATYAAIVGAYKRERESCSSKRSSLKWLQYMLQACVHPIMYHLSGRYKNSVARQDIAELEARLNFAAINNMIAEARASMPPDWAYQTVQLQAPQHMSMCCAEPMLDGMDPLSSSDSEHEKDEESDSEDEKDVHKSKRQKVSTLLETALPKQDGCPPTMRPSCDSGDGAAGASSRCTPSGRAASRPGSNKCLDGLPPLPDGMPTYEHIRAIFLKGILEHATGTRLPPRQSSKISVLVADIEARPDEQCLVFVHWDAELVYIMAALTAANVSVGSFSGKQQQHERQQQLDYFQAGRVRVLVLQIKCGCNGLNLQRASSVYFMSPDWNPANEEQAMSRAHRQGQTRRVRVVTLIARDTVEGHVYEVQRSKLEVLSAAYDEANVGLRRKHLTVHAKHLHQIMDTAMQAYADADGVCAPQSRRARSFVPRTITSSSAQTPFLIQCEIIGWDEFTL